MAKLNDEAVIQYYQQKKQTLTEELQKVDTVLGALNGKNASAAVPKKRKYTRRASVEKPAAAPKQAKTRAAGTTASATAATKPAKKQSQAAQPKKGDNWDSKIENALTKIGTADKESIVKHIAAKDPASPEKVRKALTLRLAVMEKKGKLKKEQSGESLQYRLP